MEKDKGIFSFRKHPVGELLDGKKERKRKESRLWVANARKMHRPLGMLLAAALIFNTLPVSGGVVSASEEKTGLCEHHTEHTAECGYAEGKPCTHVHGETCYRTVTACVHTHTDECYPETGETDEGAGEGNAAVSDEGNREPVNCTHQCSEESGCITKVLDCRHEHDVSCGYVEARECGYVCEICSGTKPENGMDDAENNTENSTDNDAESDTEDAGAAKEAESEKPEGADTSLCAHHKEHTADCGYSEEADTPCGYVCRVCPIEDLIAALPEKVTQDNVADVRAQLDEILALFSELNEGEQGQVDISRCLELQEALDAANKPSLAETVSAEYRDAAWDDTKKEVAYTTKTAQNCTPVTDSTEAVTWNAGWYVVKDSVTIQGLVTVSGEVHLILSDGCALLVNDGIRVDKGNSLTIYAQSEQEDTMGSLNAAASTKGQAGIGGGSEQTGGTITINGGKVTATGTEIKAGTFNLPHSSAGIGGGYKGSGGTITVNGGVVTANGGNGANYGGAGIGSGSGGGNGGTITINGGTVTANGGGMSSGGAGIGGGANRPGGKITINGGKVIAKSRGNNGGAGIGCGDNYAINENTITITGGTVEAAGGNGGAGIGGGKGSPAGTINITGSTVVVKATGSGGGAGIGSGGGYSGAYGTVTISGGTITAEGGSAVAAGKSTTITGATVNSTPYYAVIFDTTDKPGVTVPTQGIAENGTAEEPIVSVEGYFVSWCTDEACTSPYDFSTPVTGEITLYAKWEATAEAAAEVTIDGKASYYTTLRAAWNALKGKTGTILLKKDVTTQERLEVRDGMDVTVEMEEGVTLTSTAAECFYISDKGTLTLKSGTVRETLGDGVYCNIVRLTGGRLNITGGSYSSSGNGVYVDTTGRAYLSGGTFQAAPGKHALETPASFSVKWLLEPGYAVRDDAQNNLLTVSDLKGWFLKGGPYTIEECGHSDFYYVSKGDGDHEKRCNYCDDIAGVEACGYSFEQESDTGTCSKCKSEMKIAVGNNAPLTYNGTEQTPEATFRIDNGDFQAFGSEYTVTYAQNKNVGTGTATIAGGLIVGEASIPFKIERAVPSMAWGEPEETLTYTGVSAAIAEPAVTLVNEESFAGTVHYSYKKQGETAYTDGLPADAGSYTVKAHVDETDNYTAADCTKELCIERAVPSVVWGKPEATLTYTGDPAVIAEPTVTLVNKESFAGTIHYSCKKQGETAYTAGLPADAGSYTVKAHVDEAGNYTAADSTNELKLTIKKADAEITVGTAAYEVSYGDPAFPISGVTDTNPETAVQYAVTEGADVVSVSNGTVAILNAGTAAITVSLPETANYNAAENKTITVSVAKKSGYTVDALHRSHFYLRESVGSVDLTVLLPKDCGDITYQDPKTTGGVAYSAGPSVNGGKLSYTVKNGKEGDKGTITVTAATRNYEDIAITVEVGLTGRLTVSEKEGKEVTLRNDTLTYGEQLSKLVFHEAAFVDSNADVVEGSLAWKDAQQTPKAGTASAMWVFTPADDQYEKLEGNIAITVKKAVPYIAAAPAASSITYGDTLEASTLSGGDVQYGNGAGQAGEGNGSTETVAGAFTWKEPATKPAAADSGVTAYPVVFTPADAANYSSAETKAVLTVNKAQNAPNLPGGTMDVSDGTAKVGDIALPDGWEWLEADRDVVLAAGTTVSAVAVYIGAGRGNYEVETVTVDITVAKTSCDHTAGDVILYTGAGEKAPACTEDGLGHKECTKCGTVVESGITVPALGHDYTSEVTKEPTAVADGERTYTCSRCGNTYTEPVPCTTPEGLWVSGLQQSAAYTGSLVKQENIRVYHGSTLLREKTEYTISYKNNTNAGTAQVVVTGKGSYKGKAAAEFTITPASLATDRGILITVPAAVETGRNLKPAVTVIWNGKKLKEKTDYTLAYDTDIKTSSAEGYDVTITGKGNYTGTVVKKFYVASRGTKLLKKATVKGIKKSYAYQGGMQSAVPEGLEEDLKNITVKVGNTTLTKDTDYTVRMENTDAVGTGYLVVEAVQTSDYAGEKWIPFSITGTNLKKCYITGLAKTYPYTGEAVMPEIQVYTGKNGTGTQIPADAYTVRYSSHTNQGKATVTVTGIPEKGYSGSTKAAYTIGRLDLAAGEDAGNITVTMPVDIKYAKGGAKPQPVVTHSCSGTTRTLREGVDYTLKYSNHTAKYDAAASTGTKRPSVRITGTGNYSGTVTKDFTIGAQDIGALEMAATDKAYNSKKKGSYYYSAPKVYDLDGRQLQAGKDYTVQYTDEATGKPIGKKDAVADGTQIRVTVTAKEDGNYTGTLSRLYLVRGAKDVKDIAKVKNDKIAAMQYTGSEIRPKVSLYTQNGQTKNYLAEADYEIIGYYNNIKKGTATVLIRGTNAYSGVKSVTFKITAADNQLIWNGIF